MLTLLIYLYLYSLLSPYSVQTLSPTGVPKHQTLNMSMERNSMSDTTHISFIQQIIPWYLFFLKSILTWKALLIGMLIFMMSMLLYENEDIPLQQQQKSSPKIPKKRPRKKRHSDQQHSNESFIPNLPEEINQPGIEKERIVIQQSERAQNKKPKNVQQQKLLNASKKKAQKEPYSNPKCISEPPTPEVHKEVERLGAENVNTTTEAHKEVERLGAGNVNTTTEAHKEVERLGAGNVNTTTEAHKEVERLDAENVNTTTEVQWSTLLGTDGEPNEDWVLSKDQNRVIYIYNPGIRKSNQHIDYSHPKTIFLTNLYIRYQYIQHLWTEIKFHRSVDLIALSQTCKRSYIRFKSLPQLDKSCKAYMHHRAYKTCVLSMELRIEIGKLENRIDLYLGRVSSSFENNYEYLFNLAPVKTRDALYRRLLVKSVSITIDDTTVKHFFINKFLENPKWSFEEFQKFKSDLKTELVNALKEYSRLSFQSYNFVPNNEGINPIAYGKLLEMMIKMNVPFYNCPTISQFLISSRTEPLKLFLFWDIFAALKVQLLSLNSPLVLWQFPIECFTPSIMNDGYISLLSDQIARVYPHQSKGYLKTLYFELVSFIQCDFIGNNPLYRKSQTVGNRRIIFNGYMLGIRKQVEDFLYLHVFTTAGAPLAIIIKDK